MECFGRHFRSEHRNNTEKHPLFVIRGKNREIPVHRSSDAKGTRVGFEMISNEVVTEIERK